MEISEHKVIIVGDIHAHNYKSFNVGDNRLNNIIELINYLFRYAFLNKVKKIIIVGDLHNNMEVISTKVVNRLIKCFKNNFNTYNNIDVLALSGNHDFATKNLIDSPGESALNYLNQAFEDRFLLSSNHLSIDYSSGIEVCMHFVPYYEYPEHFKEAVRKINIKLHQFNYLFTHQLVGLGIDAVDEDISFDDPLFNNFEIVFNGHVHYGRKVSPGFINVGSPIHRDAGDMGIRKGFWIMNLYEPSTLEFHDITEMFPQFIYKKEDESLTEWESKQYIIRQPVIEKTSEEDEISEKFAISLRPETIIKNYCKEVGEEDKLSYGMNLLKRNNL